MRASKGPVVDEARKAGAMSILVAPMSRRLFRSADKITEKGTFKIPGLTIALQLTGPASRSFVASSYYSRPSY